jgi:hypothetical protein
MTVCNDLMVGLSTYFDKCDVGRIEGISEDVMTCINSMGENDIHVLYDSKRAVCEYHYCAIILNRDTDRHNKITCSGGILNFGDGLFFNPITPFIMKFADMVALPPSAVDVMGVDMGYYYVKDVRTTFAENVIGINCTNDFKTCLTFSDTSVCFGNVRDINVHHSSNVVVWGVISSLFIGAFVIFILMPKFKRWSLWYLIAAYLIPVIGVSCLYVGIFIAPDMPFIMANMMIFALFPIIYYPMRDLK